MVPNPALGVFFHWLGSLASGRFYVPYRGVKRWSWETNWLVGGFFSWIIAPWVLGSFLTRDLLPVLAEAPAKTLFRSFFFGLLWRIGGLTFGLTMCYLGLSIGMSLAKIMSLCEIKSLHSFLNLPICYECCSCSAPSGCGWACFPAAFAPIAGCS